MDSLEQITRDSGISVFRGNRSDRLVVIRSAKRRRYAGVDRPTPFNLPAERWWKGRVPPRRDSMKGKCYKAEDITRRMYNPKQVKFADIDELARYVRDIIETDWFQRRWPKFAEIVVRQRGKSTCYGGPTHTGTDGMVTQGRITISTWGMGWHAWKKGKQKREDADGGELIVLHELAHAITHTCEHHGRLWVRTYLELVRLKLGQELYEHLRQQFENHRVRCNPFRTVTDEMKQRLAACRPPGFGKHSNSDIQPSTTEKPDVLEVAISQYSVERVCPALGLSE